MAAAGPDGAADPTSWIDAKQAYYVIEGSFVGGMGAADAMPFSDKTRALAFAQAHGGRVVSFSEMPEDYVFAQ
ncbi:NosL [compost metagenome]